MAKAPWFRGIIRAAGWSSPVTARSTASAIPFQGINTIYSTAASKVHNLRAPKKVGDQVTLVCRQATTAKFAYVVLPAGYSFFKTSNSTGTTFRKAAFSAGNQSLTLQTTSTSRVAIISNVNTVTVGTS